MAGSKFVCKVDAATQDGTCKDSMLEQNTQENEMEIGIKNRNITK